MSCDLGAQCCAVLMHCRKNGREQIQVNTEFPGLSVVSSMDGGHTWTEIPVGASRRNTTLMLATRYVQFSPTNLHFILLSIVIGHGAKNLGSYNPL